MAFNGGVTSKATYRPSAFDLWIDAKYGNFSEKRKLTENDGHFGIIYAGADYVVNRSLLVGTYVQFDSMAQQFDSTQANVKGTGWMAGPYATLRLSDHVFLQGRAAWGQSTNRISPYMTYEDTFGSDRWLVASTLKGRWSFGPWQFRPSASVSYIEDVSRSYIDSLGVAIPSVKTSLGQLKIGPEIMHRSVTDGRIIIEPRFGIEAIHNFAGTKSVLDGSIEGPLGLRGKAEGGIRFTSPEGLSLDLSTGYDGIGTRTYNSVSAKALVRIPLQ